MAPDGVDLVVEVAPAQNNELDVAVTKVHGTVAIYANNGGDELTRASCARSSPRTSATSS